MKIKLLLSVLFITSLFCLTGCGGNKEDAHIQITVNNSTDFVMDANATTTIPFTVYPTDTNIGELKIMNMDYVGTSNDDLAFKQLDIEKITPASEAGSYIAHIIITNMSRDEQFVPKADKRYDIGFTGACFYIGAHRSSGFRVTFTQE